MLVIETGRGLIPATLAAGFTGCAQHWRFLHRRRLDLVAHGADRDLDGWIFQGAASLRRLFS